MKKACFRLTHLLALVLVLGSIAAIKPKRSPNPDFNKMPGRAVAASDIKVPAGFKATVFAEDVGAARHMAVSKTGDLYVKLSKLKDGKGVYRLRDTDNDGVIDERIGFGDYPGTGIFIKKGYLYTSSNTAVYRYKLNEKEEVVDTEKPERLVYGLVAKGRDESKSIVVDNNDNIYVNVAAYNDACRMPGTGQGMMPCPLLDSAGGIWQFKANVLDQTYAPGIKFATGLKNVVGLDWNNQTNSLFVMMHGRGKFDDFYPQYYTPQMSGELPAETMYELRKGVDAGWPYIYYDHKQKKKILAPEYGGDGKKTAGEKAINPLAAFPAHLGPNGLLFYTGTMFPAKYKNGAFIAFHGQSPELKKGYMVAFVPFKNGKPSGNWEIFADNFAGIDLAKPTGPVQHRPCGLAQGPDGSLYVSDDLNGTIYRITYASAKAQTALKK